MLQSHVPNRENCHVLKDRVTRQSFVVAKVEQDGLPGEAQAARRMLRMLEAKLAAARRREPNCGET